MRTLAMIKKEITHIRRDIRVLYFSVIWPVLLLLLFGYTVDMDVRNIRVGFADLDGTPRSRGFYQALKNIGSFNLDYVQSMSWAECDRALRQGVLRTIVVVPDGFSRQLARGENAEFQVLIDGSDNNTARIVMSYVLAAAQGFYQSSGTIAGPVMPRMVFLYNPSLRSQNFIVPGLIAVIIMIICTLITSTTIAGEWDRGTMEQLLYTPVKPYELILGKLTPYLVIGFIQVTLVLLTGIVVFGVPFRGSLILFYFASLLFILGSLGAGLFISLLAKNQQISTMTAFLTSVLPAFLLSGFIFPINSMPAALQVVASIVPARYFLHVTRSIFLKGSLLPHFWTDLAALALFAAGFLLLSVARFKKRLS
jgi:ABC-2 type transport system permease protein